VWLTDRNSTNGTYLNGQRVVDSQLLEFGHKIRLGSRVDSSRACALEFQSPDYLFAGPTDRGSTVLAAR
jgi:pSer/pThr/pTyr-binding forkhead associated (FHA) protein